MIIHLVSMQRSQDVHSKTIPGGVGSHSATSGIYHTNMSFASNTFENIDNVCIDLQKQPACNSKR